MDIKPSRELDALVAEKVMGRIFTRHLCEPGTPRREWVDNDVPHYSTDIAAAWQVVEELRNRKYVLRLESSPYMAQTEYWMGVFGFKGVDEEAWILEINYSPKIPSAPLAICIAALKALGEYRDEICTAALKSVNTL